MKKRGILLITLSMITLAAIGCQSNKTTMEDEATITSENTTQATTSQNMTTEEISNDDSNPISDDAANTDNSNIANSDDNNSDTEIQPKTKTDNNSNDNSDTTQNKITEKKAKQIALKDAKVDEKDITHIRIKEDFEDGRPVYEVEFYLENKEYDYDIDQNTGEIISKDYDIEDDFYQTSKNKKDSSNQKTSKIDKEKAIKIALDKVPGATKQNLQIEFDLEDGKEVYEGEIHYNQKEYDFEINAQNGEIIKWSEERDD